MIGAGHRPDCYRRLAASVRPRERLTVSQWADRHRILSSKQASMPGRWRTRVNPLLEEIMDCLSATSPVKEIVVIKSNQVGVTEAMINALGYIMHHAPGPAMVLMPTACRCEKAAVIFSPPKGRPSTLRRSGPGAHSTPSLTMLQPASASSWPNAS